MACLGEDVNFYCQAGEISQNQHPEKKRQGPRASASEGPVGGDLSPQQKNNRLEVQETKC